MSEPNNEPSPAERTPAICNELETITAIIDRAALLRRPPTPDELSEWARRLCAVADDVTRYLCPHEDSYAVWRATIGQDMMDAMRDTKH